MPTYPEQQLAKSEDLVRLAKFAKLHQRALRLFPEETQWESTAADALHRLKSSALDYIAHEVHESGSGSRIPKLSPALQAPCEAISGILERHISAGADSAERRNEALKVVAPYVERAVDGTLASKIADQINSTQNAAPDTRRQSHRFTSESVTDLLAQVGKFGEELSRGVRETATCFDDRRIDSLTTVRSGATVRAQIEEIGEKLESEQLADWVQRQDGERQMTYDELRARFGQTAQSLREESSAPSGLSDGFSTPLRRDSSPAPFTPDVDRNTTSAASRSERNEPAEEPDNLSPWSEQMAVWVQQQDGDRQMTYEELEARYGGAAQSPSDDESRSPSHSPLAPSPILSTSDRNTHSPADRDEQGAAQVESSRDIFRRKRQLEESDDEGDASPEAKRRQLDNRSRSRSVELGG